MPNLIEIGALIAELSQQKDTKFDILVLWSIFRKGGFHLGVSQEFKLVWQLDIIECLFISNQEQLISNSKWKKIPWYPKFLLVYVALTMSYGVVIYFDD